MKFECTNEDWMYKSIIESINEWVNGNDWMYK